MEENVTTSERLDWRWKDLMKAIFEGIGPLEILQISILTIYLLRLVVSQSILKSL